MIKKIFTLLNKGMNRDLSISKAGESSAYENHNIRILSRDNDTALSVTNERGNKRISLSSSITGTVIGWNVLNNHLVVFTTASGAKPDRIYRIDYKDPESQNEFDITLLYNDDLKFNDENPIESVVYYESETIQKIYWVDGKNPLRMMNFMAGADEMALWTDDYFDSNRTIQFGIEAEISKDNSGNTRANGVVQYLLTYYNEHGQETACAWISDLVYLSPKEHGGSPDGYNNNKVTLTFSNLDTRYTNFRIYSIVRTSYNGVVTAYIVADEKTSDSPVIVIDDAAHLTAYDAAALLYLGSQTVIPGTLTHKDQTLFLGDLTLSERKDYTLLEEEIRNTMFVLGQGGSFVDGTTWESSAVSFTYSDVNNPDLPDITNADSGGLYVYNNQLQYSSSGITTFKGGEKYRFGLVFRTKNGVNTDAFWIGDKVNDLYPVMSGGEEIHRVGAYCVIPYSVIQIAQDLEFGAVQLVIAEATYADRSVKAQGVLNPTVFNVWNRKNNRLYGSASWITRPRNSMLANRHFDVIHNADSVSGEIACNYWEDDEAPKPYYRLENYGTSDESYYGVNEEDFVSDCDYALLIFTLQMKKSFGRRYTGKIDAIKVTMLSDGNDALQYLGGYNFPDGSLLSALQSDGLVVYNPNDSSEPYFRIKYIPGNTYKGTSRNEYNKKDLWEKLSGSFEEEFNLPAEMMVDYEAFSNYYGIIEASSDSISSICINPKCFPYYLNGSLSGVIYYVARMGTDGTTSDPGLDRFFPTIDASGLNAYDPSYDKKNFMFVDENLVTLDSPEFSYEAVSLDSVDGIQLRIIGAAKITSCISDYVINARHGLLPGENVVKTNFSGTSEGGYIDGLVTWPLWTDRGLDLDASKIDLDDKDAYKEIEDRSYNDYVPGGSVVRYWLHLWEKAGSIPGYAAEESGAEGDPAYLHNKTFANLRFAGSTIYQSNRLKEFVFDDLDDIRMVRDTSPQYLWMTIGEEKRHYSGALDESLGMPRLKKYPILYNSGAPAIGTDPSATGMFLYTNLPVTLSYSTGFHAALSLHSWLDESGTHPVYRQNILPHIYTPVELEEAPSSSLTGLIVPWEDAVSSRVNLLWTEYPFEFTIVNADYANNIITFSRTQETPVSQESYFIEWQKAFDYFGSANVYTIVKWRPHHTVNYYYHYLVNITNYSISADGFTLTFTGKYLASIEENTSGTEQIVNYARFENASTTPIDTGVKILDVGMNTVTNYASDDYIYLDYAAESEQFDLEAGPGSAMLTQKDQFVLVGELFYDYDSDPLNDPRYGGISLSNVQKNKFIPASRLYSIDGISDEMTVIGNQSDTYFQRWDDYRIKPLAQDSTNSVVDIMSVMLETHINIDGRYDALRGTSLVASIGNEDIGSINRVYSQEDNFMTSNDLDDDFNYGTYHSSITWTMEKHDMEQTDEWMHITLANSLNLDGDKGYCRALRRLDNNLIAFQDRGIAEILFNSRTQLSTTSGVPVEIANSGKVDGKRYITNKYGCINKWSIVEGKAALYFVDNINKMFGSLSGSLDNISSRLGFSEFFRRANDIMPWTPKDYNNVVSYYDRIHSDVYLVMGNGGGNEECLVYNEELGVFTSFFDYPGISLMANLEDRFVSMKKGNQYLWLQNEGLYCNFFGTQYNYWVNYRVTPDPYGDKVWTNLEYRADSYRVLNASGDSSGIPEGQLIDYRYYQPEETFDTLTVWDEYQTTGDVSMSKVVVDRYADIRKKFRIWRMDIPRAQADASNKYGFDRIRNPWANIMLKKTVNASNGQNRNLMQIHDINAIYFE